MKPLIYYRVIGMFCNVGDKWDKLSPTEEEAIEFAHKNINPEPKRQISETQYSFEYCLAHYGENINERLRHATPNETDLKISDMVALHKTKIPLVLYRGVCEAVFKLMKENAKNMDDADLYEKSFLQTSLVKGHEIRSRYRLRIYVPEDAQAIYLGNVNDEQYYYEVDLQKGSKLKIVSFDGEYINCKLIGNYDKENESNKT